MAKINTIVIPIIRDDFIGRLLYTLDKYTLPNYNVIVIDQTQGDTAYLENHKKVALWIKSYRNLGFSKAMNTGMRLADTEYITLANDDIEFMDSRWWNGIVSAFQDDPKIIAVNPMSPKEATWGYGYTNENHETWQPKEGFAVSDETKLGMIPIFDGVPLNYKEEFTKEDYDNLLNRHPSWTANSACDAIAMWCTVFKYTGLEEIGRLEERFYPGGGEDYDMNARAYSCGFPEPREECNPEFHRRMIGTSKSWVWHHWGKSRDLATKHHAEPFYSSRERWNANDQLWSPSFDVWGHYQSNDGKKKPIHRIKDIGVDEL